MKMPIIESYLDDLIKNSTLDVPAWNIEAARKGGKSGWNYIDGCMILAMIETWKITGEKKYLDFAEAYIDHRVQEDGTIKGYNPEDYILIMLMQERPCFCCMTLLVRKSTARQLM